MKSRETTTKKPVKVNKTITKEKYKNQKIILKTDHLNPFNRWSDWYGTNGEAAITIRTIQHHIYENWEKQCVRIEGGEYIEQEDGSMLYKADDAERIVEHENFDASKVKAPGIYKDRTNYDDEDKVDESYSIIIPYSFLSPKLCRKWIEKLNEEFDRKFELSIPQSLQEDFKEKNGDEE